jgi:hypothetical protein
MHNLLSAEDSKSYLRTIGLLFIGFGQHSANRPSEDVTGCCTRLLRSRRVADFKLSSGQHIQGVHPMNSSGNLHRACTKNGAPLGGRAHLRRSRRFATIATFCDNCWHRDL